MRHAPLTLLVLVLMVGTVAPTQVGAQDIPYFVMDPAGGGGYATNLLYRWVHTDLATNTFTSWPDRLQGRTLGTPASFTMRNTSSGVSFSGPSANLLTNGGTTAVMLTSTNWAVGFMLLTSNYNDSLGGTRFLNGEGGLYVAAGGSGDPVRLREMPANAFYCAIPSTQWYDILLVQTNATSGAQSQTVYTNGVLAIYQAGSTTVSLVNIGLYSITPPNTFGYYGCIREIWCRTNGLFSSIDIQNMATDLHYTRTNLYGP